MKIIFNIHVNNIRMWQQTVLSNLYVLGLCMYVCMYGLSLFHYYNTIQYNIGLMNGMSERMPLTKIDELV